MQIRKTIRIILYSISFDNTWCIVPSISTGTIKSALWTGCNKTKNTLHEIHDQDSVTYWHYFAGQQPFVFERLGAKKTFYWIFQDVFSTWLSGPTKQPPFCHVTSGSSKWCLRNDCRNLILMMRHCPDLRSASDWLVEANFHPIRSTTQIWVVTSHQCGISASVSQTSFCRETRGGITKCQLSAYRATCAAKSIQ